MGSCVHGLKLVRDIMVCTLHIIALVQKVAYCETQRVGA